MAGGGQRFSMTSGSRAAQSHAQRSEHGEHGRSEPFTRRRRFHTEMSSRTFLSSAGLPSGERSFFLKAGGPAARWLGGSLRGRDAPLTLRSKFKTGDDCWTVLSSGTLVVEVCQETAKRLLATPAGVFTASVPPPRLLKTWSRYIYGPIPEIRSAIPLCDSGLLMSAICPKTEVYRSLNKQPLIAKTGHSLRIMYFPNFGKKIFNSP